VPVRGELVPGPGRFEIEVLDADPRRVKKLKIFVSHDLSDRRRRDPQRRMMSSTQSPASSGPSELPVNRDTVKLSPEESPPNAPPNSPPKAPRTS
jgi:hypothetical protein